MSDKNSFRRSAKEKLQKEVQTFTYTKDKIFEKNILSFIKKTSADNILIFLPLAIEPNVLGAIKKLRKMKKRVYIPFIEDINFKIVKYRLPVKVGAYGIAACANSYELIKKIDLAIVPAVGVDASLARVGFGKGMYDRFFDSLGYRPLVAFAQRTLCFSPKKLGEAHDIVGDYLILPNKIFAKGRGNNVNNSVNSYGGRCIVRANRICSSKKIGFRKISDIRRAIKIKS